MQTTVQSIYSVTSQLGGDAMRVVFCVVVAILTVADARSCLFARQAIEEIEECAIMSRAAIRSGHVTLHVNASDCNGEQRETYDIRFDEHRVREDVTRVCEPADCVGGQAAYTRTTIAGPDRFYTYSDQLLKNGTTYALYYDDRSNVRRDVWKAIPDPRVIGLAPDGVQASFAWRLNSFLTGPNRSDLKVEERQLGGVTCKVIAGVDTRFGVQFEEWIAPQQGYSVLRVRSSLVAEGVEYVDQVDVAVAQDPPSQVFFPTSTAFKRTEVGNVVMEQNAKIAVQCLNCMLADSLFDVKSMNVPPGTPVAYAYESNKRAFWNGASIEEERFGHDLAHAADAVSDGRWALVSLNLAVIAAVLALMALKRRGA